MSLNTKTQIGKTSSDDILCMQVVTEVVQRIRDHEFVAANLMETAERLQMEGVSLALSLSHGWPGLIVLFDALDRSFPHEGWDQEIHRSAISLRNAIEQIGLADPSLFSGTAGCCFAISQAMKEGRLYGKLLSKLNQHLIHQVERSLFPKIEEKIALQLPMRMELYDITNGIIGIGAYSLSNLKDIDFENITKKILQYAVAISGTISVSGRQIPAWYAPCHYQFIEEDKIRYPKGNFNMGMAHGIAGVLALLSLSLLKECSVAGQKEAITRIAYWLLEKKSQLNGNVWWADRISWEQELEGEATSPYIGSDAWCYGSAGVCRSLFLAGKALDDCSLIQAAHEGFLSIAARSSQRWQINTPSFCHGFAGLFTLAQLMARDLECPVLQLLTQDMRKVLLSCYRPDVGMGFMDREPLLRDVFALKEEDNHNPIAHIMVEKGGLLDGTTGIVLPLLSSTTRDFGWARAFLIEE